jgi:hypothetical protein
MLPKPAGRFLRSARLLVAVAETDIRARYAGSFLGRAFVFRGLTGPTPSPLYDLLDRGFTFAVTGHAPLVDGVVGESRPWRLIAAPTKDRPEGGGPGF